MGIQVGTDILGRTVNRTTKSRGMFKGIRVGLKQFIKKEQGRGKATMLLVKFPNVELSTQ